MAPRNQVITIASIPPVISVPIVPSLDTTSTTVITSLLGSEGDVPSGKPEDLVPVIVEDPTPTTLIESDEEAAMLVRRRAILISEGREKDLREAIEATREERRGEPVASPPPRDVRLRDVATNLHNEVEDHRSKGAVEELLSIPLPEGVTVKDMIAECTSNIDHLGDYMSLPEEWVAISSADGGRSKTKVVLEILQSSSFLDAVPESFSFSHVGALTTEKVQVVLAHVWSIIRRHHHRQFLTLRLAQEIYESKGSCTDGKVKRIINCLFGYVDLGFNTVAGSGDVFQMAFTHKVLRSMMTPEQRMEAAIDVLDEYGIHGKVREEWIAALDDI